MPQARLSPRTSSRTWCACSATTGPSRRCVGLARGCKSRVARALTAPLDSGGRRARPAAEFDAKAALGALAALVGYLSVRRAPLLAVGGAIPQRLTAVSSCSTCLRVAAAGRRAQLWPVPPQHDRPLALHEAGRLGRQGGQPDARVHGRSASPAAMGPRPSREADPQCARTVRSVPLRSSGPQEHVALWPAQHVPHPAGHAPLSPVAPAAAVGPRRNRCAPLS